MSEHARLHSNSQTLSLSFESSLIQSCMRLADPDELVLDYTRAMMSFLLLNPNPAHILMIGLGGGSIHKYVHRHLLGTDITTVELRATLVANSISTMASELNDKLMQTPWLVDKKSEQQTITMLEALSRELERLLEIKRQLEAQQR